MVQLKKEKRRAYPNNITYLIFPLPAVSEDQSLNEFLLAGCGPVLARAATSEEASFAQLLIVHATGHVSCCRLPNSYQ